MRTLQEKYNGVLEGKFSKTQFRRDAAIEMPQFVSTVNSFDDTVAILKNKGAITEAKKNERYFESDPADHISPDVLDTGIKCELEKKFNTTDVTPEQYEKAKETAVKNLTKDRAYYAKESGEQLDTPSEQMEKAKLNEGMSKEEAWKKFQKDNNVTDKTIKVAREDFEKEWEAGNLEEVNETVDTDDLRAKIANILKGQLSSLNKMGGDAIIEDYLETQIQAYLDGDVDVEEPMEVVNDFRYYMDANQSAAADFNADLEPDDTTPETLEEDVVDLPMTAAGYSRGETYNTEKYGKVKIIDQLDGDDIPAAYGRFRVEKINEEDLDATEKAASTKIGAGEEFTDDDAAAVADKMPKIKKDTEFKLIGEDEPDVEDLYQHDQEYLDTLKKRKALKEMFKKIIVNLINE